MTVWIFTHGDGDGVCAGAVALAANPDAKVFFTHPVGLLGDLNQVREGDTVIICDIALSEMHLEGLIERFKTIEKTGLLHYFDHHPLPEGLRAEDIPGVTIHRLDASASEIVYSYFKEKVGVLQSRAAIYGAISDYADNTPTIKGLLKMWDKRTIYLDTGILVQALSAQKREYNLKRKVVSELAAGDPPSSDDRLVELAIQQARREEEAISEIEEKVKVEGRVSYVLDFPFSLGKTAIYARALTGTIIGIAGETRKGMIDMSLRTAEERIDLNVILRRITPKLGGSGGGHPQASGARVPKENFKALVEELNRVLEALY